MLPLILKIGLVSHAFAGKFFKTELIEGYEPIVQKNLEYRGGFDLISTNDPLLWGDLNEKRQLYKMSFVREKEKPTTIAYHIRNSPEGVVTLIISGRLRDTRKIRSSLIPIATFGWRGERFVRRRIPPREIIGIVASENIAFPLAPFEESICSTSNINKDDFNSSARHDTFGVFRQIFLERPFTDPELEEMRLQYQQANKQLQEELLELAQIFEFVPVEKGFNPSWRIVNSDGRYFMNHIPIDIFPGMHTHTQGMHTRVKIAKHRIIISDDQKLIETGAKYVSDLKDKIQAYENKGKKMSLEEFSQICTSKYFRDRSLPIPKWHVHVSNDIPAEKDSKNYPPLRPTTRLITPSEIVETMEKIIQLRQTRAQIYKDIWPKYLESVAGKSLGQATVGDFLVGLCKERGIPLYDKQGKVLWPPQEEEVLTERSTE